MFVPAYIVIFGTSQILLGGSLKYTSSLLDQKVAWGLRDRFFFRSVAHMGAELSLQRTILISSTHNDKNTSVFFF